jgi:hypothetical protein
MVPFWWGFAMLVALLASMAAAVVGLMPTGGRFEPEQPGGLDAYRVWDAGVVSRKAWSVRIGVVLLGVAFGIGVLGMAVKGEPADPARIGAAAP